MNLGLDIALAVELQRRVILAMLTAEDRVELLLRNWRPPVEDGFALASDFKL